MSVKAARRARSLLPQEWRRRGIPAGTCHRVERCRDADREPARA